MHENEKGEKIPDTKGEAIQLAIENAELSSDQWKAISKLFNLASQQMGECVGKIEKSSGVSYSYHRK